MSDVATYVHIASYHGMKLEFPVNEDHFKWCQVSSDEFTYEWLAASPEFWQLGANKILGLLDEAHDIVFRGGSPARNGDVIRDNLYGDSENYSLTRA
jgi:hypothetical protein